MNSNGCWVFYRDRPEWSDIEPLPQSEPCDEPILRIAYSEKFIDIYNYLRAVMAKDERSERAFTLTTEALYLNPANYCVWFYRRHLLKDLNKDLRQEMKFVKNMIYENPKNYQVWYHRRWLVENLNDCSDEFHLTDDLIDDDSKNYHAWEYRQWFVQRFSLWKEELENTQRIIRAEPLCNSPWNQRYFVIENMKTLGLLEDSFMNEELLFTESLIQDNVNNEGAWSYLRAMGDLSNDPKWRNYLKSFCNKLQVDYPVETSMASSLILCLVDILEEDLKLNRNESTLSTISSLYDQMAEEVDPNHKLYWNFCKEKHTNSLTG